MLSTLSNNLTYLLRVAILYFVLSSKHFFIYNEETLVALCFLAFMIFSFTYFSDSIQEFLDERRNSIQLELQDFLSLKETFLNQLIESHEKPLQTKIALEQLGVFSSAQLSQLCNSREVELKTIFSQQMHQKLKTINYSQKVLEEKLQASIALGFREAVLEEFQRSKKKLKAKLINQALQALKK